MATRAVLAELAQAYTARTGVQTAIASVGGVDAAKRVAAGEFFDVVFLASDALDKLIAAGHVLPGRVDLVRSPVALAVRAGTPHPDVSSEAALKQAVLAAPTLGYSTGPSGNHLAALFERWGIADAVRERVVVPPPGVPVGQLVAEGRVALGFQQLSELMSLPGIDVLGLLPAGTEFITTFSAGVAAVSPNGDAVRAMLDDMASPDADAAKQRHGMAPARDGFIQETTP
ncbi:MAG: substrate-binding domain-containing protein [Burkholderiaceae bacterium]|nr:substrate-binding domain-containing protein [Rhodoferax sp.]MCP5285947.1 substrate-binding domain-containing protein [Burkholderiaceae bacterium]